MAFLRIHSSVASGSGSREDGKAAQQGDSYVERLLKLIPAEAIGIYLVGVQVVGSDGAEHVPLAKWTLACAIFVVVFRALLSTESPKLGVEGSKSPGDWWKTFRKEAQWPAVFIATISFLIWATALGYPIAPWLTDRFNACNEASVICAGEPVGTLMLLLWTPLAAFLYSGERVGNLAPARDVNDGQQAGSELADPSPKDALPPPSQREVLDPDDRLQPPSLARSPFQSIALLHVYRSGHSQPARMGTGWLATPRHIVTAAHVLSSGARVRCWVGYDGDNDTWGAYIEARHLRLHPRYVNDLNPDYDIAVIELPNPLAVPILNIGDPTAQSSDQYYCAGFPEDKGGLTMYEARGRKKHQVGNRSFHDIDTDDGQSGSPIWSGMGHKVVAVHTGHGGDPHPDLNRAVSMNAEIVKWLGDQFN